MFAVVRSTRLLGGLIALVMTGMLATQTVEIAVGDTLSEIAAANEVSVADLVEWNDIADADFIVAGDSLLVRVETGDGPPTTYVIRPGDSLSVLAGRFGSTVGALVAANGISDPDHIVIGRVLRHSGADAAPDATTDGQSMSYVVKPGDTLLAIARAHGLNTTELVDANGLADPDRIFIGQLLKIPLESGSETDTPTTTPPSTTVPTTTTPPPSTTVPTTTTPPPSTTVPRPAPGTSTALVGYFDKWSTAYGIDQGLLEALLWKESGWQADAVGPGGHLGIGQLSPDTVEFIEQRLLGLDLDPLDASDGIRMAARFLRYLLDRTDNVRTAMAAWNQGLHSVNTSGISTTGGSFADDVLAIYLQRS